MVPRKEPANSRGSVAENYSLHMPASKAAAAARWGPALCEEDSRTGRTFVYNARVGGRWGVVLHVYFLVLLSFFEVKIYFPLWKDGVCFWSVIWIWSKLACSWIRFTTFFNVPWSEKKKTRLLVMSGISRKKRKWKEGKYTEKWCEATKQSAKGPPLCQY